VFVEAVPLPLQTLFELGRVTKWSLCLQNSEWLFVASRMTNDCAVYTINPTLGPL